MIEFNGSPLLDGQVAVVTGAGQGMGREIAIGLAAAGANSTRRTVRAAMFDSICDHFGKNLGDREKLIERQSASEFEFFSKYELVGEARPEGAANITQMLP